uniref:Probable DNA polymerase n=1 Tax=Macrolepiota fuliginosa TaxID=201230 RepID=A0A5Q0N4N1_9AGAR|nr:hypothetical protein [Macrolepiota fuliginosa]QFZ98747.1 hypothetical protein [Macrolepiota fuliginosa]
MDPLKYGKVTYIDRMANTYIVKINAMNEAHVTISDKSNKVEIFSNGDLIMKYTDRLIDQSKFIRTIGDNSYLFKNDSLELFKTIKPIRFIKKRKQSRKLNERFITLDIETFIENNEHVPYLIACFDGKNSNSFFLSDYESKEDMFKACILSLCKAKYHRYRIYIHNLANFDGIFLLKELVKIGKVKPLINDGKLIQIQLEFTPENTNYSIILEFRDNYKIYYYHFQNYFICNRFRYNFSIFCYRRCN